MKKTILHCWALCLLSAPAWANTPLPDFAPPAEGQQAGADTAWHWRRQARAIDGQLLQVDIQVAADAGGQVLAEASLVRSLR